MILSEKNERNLFHMIFKGGTIRVVSPVTEDGNRPKIDPYTDKPMYREDFFPRSAKKAFEEQNKKLPNHLKKKIELLTDDVVASPVIEQEIPEKKKPGPKPKAHATN